MEAPTITPGMESRENGDGEEDKTADGKDEDEASRREQKQQSSDDGGADDHTRDGVQRERGRLERPDRQDRGRVGDRVQVDERGVGQDAREGRRGERGD